jgi:Common central domain of tyrosinase/Polyphenol oxidase middle domain
MTSMRSEHALLVRREIWSLQQGSSWDPYTLAYAAAIREMQGREFPADQTSYAYQAAMHGTDATAGNGPDGVWNMCQHQSWFFLPWHRMYILWFERIVRDIVQSRGGPADWALPYWNWQSNRVLPPAFRERELPTSAGGGPNPLFVADRVRVNEGNRMVPAVVDSSAADATVPFVGGAGGGFGFGGGVIGRPSHFGAGATGELERQPHNAVHRTINGTMGTAGSPGDPIFWLHHAQIDRLWGRWLRLGGGRANPTDSRWLDQQFDFYDAGGTRVTQTPREVLSTTSLGYHYDDDPPPAALPLTALVPEQAEAALKLVQSITVLGANPEELGTSGSVTLGAGATSITIELAERAGVDLDSLAAPAASPSTVALVVEGIELEDPAAPTYEVYLNMTDVGAGGHHDSPHFVGFLEFFGADHEHVEHAEHAKGAKRVFNITGLVHQLRQEGEWDPARAQVSFVPARVFEDAGTGELLPAPDAGEAGVHIGAVRILAE